MTIERLRVALDVQHLHRMPPFAGDRGARFTYPDGSFAWEGDLASGYVAACIRALRAAGAHTLTNRDGSPVPFVGYYSTRQRLAGAWGAHAYLACHVNAGGGRYGLVRPPGGGLWSPANLGRARQVSGATTLAQAILSSLVGLPEINGTPLKSLSLGDRGLVCIRRTPTPTCPVLVEPFFGDQPAHRALATLDGLRRVGEAIASGLLGWWERIGPSWPKPTV